MAISIVDHVVTIKHDEELSTNQMNDLLSSNGYEVFEVVLDARFPKVKPRRSKESLDNAIQSWYTNPTKSDEQRRVEHCSHCQMCAEHRRTTNTSLQSVCVVDSDDVPVYKTIFSVDGMSCNSCVGIIARTLKEIDSVRDADVSLLSGSATIYFQRGEPDQAVKEIMEAIESTGYSGEILSVTPEMTINKTLDTKNQWEATYSINEMSCSSCVSKISKAVQKLSFVNQVEVNLIMHSSTVIFTGKENETLVQETIDAEGYQATLTDLKCLVKGEGAARNAYLKINGMHCANCPERIRAVLEKYGVQIEKMAAINDPILMISYIPHAPEFTIRSIIDVISKIDDMFDVTMYTPPSVEERSRKMLGQERKMILFRTLLAVIVAIPTLIIGIIYMDLVSKNDPGSKFLMHPVHGISRAEWATFIMATPVYFFAADIFHRRTVRELYALWRPGNSIPISRRFFRFGSMNMLISLGTTIAYMSSLVELAIAASHPKSDKPANSRQSYFDSVVFLTMFLLLGRLAEAHMKAKAGDAVEALGKLRSLEANLVVHSTDGAINTLEQVGVELIEIGDIVKIPSGSSPPCDGTLLDEEAIMDESSLTGESGMIHKKGGDVLFSGTINKGGAVHISVTGPAGASMLDSIIQVVREGQAKRAPMERIADLLTALFVPVIVLIAIITWIVWLGLSLSGSLPQDYLDNDIGGWSFWSLQFAIAVFVIACPCGLGLAAPTALFVGSGIAAKKGILVKGGGEAFQEASVLDGVVFDKTGTLTQGSEPQVVDNKLFVESSSFSSPNLFGILKAVEENSNHPLARAAVKFATYQSSTMVQVLFADEIAGKGLKATFKIAKDTTYTALAGNEKLMHDYEVPISSECSSLLNSWKSKGLSVILLACLVEEQWELNGVFAAADSLRPESISVVKELQAQDISVWMLSGDNPTTARAVGMKVGIPAENIIAGLLPTQKAEKVKHLQRTTPIRSKKGWLGSLVNRRNRATIAMVGDGINDSPALAAADVGIAIASGSDVAVQSAAFVLVHSDLQAVCTLVVLSRAVFQRVVINFFWAAIYNMIALPIAAGVLYPIKTSSDSHVRLDPTWAALAMALSSISVVSSSLMLRTKIPLVGFRVPQEKWSKT